MTEKLFYLMKHQRQRCVYISEVLKYISQLNAIEFFYFCNFLTPACFPVLVVHCNVVKIQLG